mgnify:CR=1 FL=1
MVKRRSLPAFELLKNNLQRLVEVGEKLNKIHPEHYYEARRWTPLKLILLMIYVAMYSKIMVNRRDKGLFPKRIFYIDPLAGTGINKIKDTGDVVAGSPIISIIFSSGSFDKYFFAESVLKRKETLQARISKLLPQEKFYIGKECNALLNQVASQLSEIKEAHYLLFIDCEGIEPRWRNVSNILRYPGDLIFVFQTVEIWEQIYRWKNYSSVTDFFGTEDWKKANKKEQLVEIYKKQLSNVTIMDGSKRKLIDHITVKGDVKEGSFHYDIIFAAKETTGGSPWFRNFLEYAKRKIAKHTGKSVEKALNIMKGRDTQLDWFISAQRKLIDFL